MQKIFEKCPRCGHEVQVVKFEHATIQPPAMPESELIGHLRDLLDRANEEIARMRAAPPKAEET